MTGAKKATIQESASAPLVGTQKRLLKPRDCSSMCCKNTTWGGNFSYITFPAARGARPKLCIYGWMYVHDLIGFRRQRYKKTAYNVHAIRNSYVFLTEREAVQLPSL